MRWKTVQNTPGKRAGDFPLLVSDMDKPQAGRRWKGKEVRHKGCVLCYSGCRGSMEGFFMEKIQQ